MHESFAGDSLAGALRATFERRGTKIPTELPIAFTPAFAVLEDKEAQWSAFIGRIRSSTNTKDLRDVVAAIAGFVGPVLAAAAGKHQYPFRWGRGGPWISSGPEAERALR
jgi:hypothetical protein